MLVTCVLISECCYGMSNSPLWLGADLVNDGAENGTVAMIKLGVPRVGDVKIVGSILHLKQRQEAAAD